MFSVVCPPCYLFVVINITDKNEFVNNKIEKNRKKL